MAGVQYGNYWFASKECNEYKVYKALNEALKGCHTLDMNKYYKLLKTKISKAKEKYGDYADNYRISKRDPDSKQLNRIKAAGAQNKVKEAQAAALDLQQKLELVVNGLKFEDSNDGHTAIPLVCNGEWVSKADEKKRHKEEEAAAKKQREAEKAAKKQQKEDEKAAKKQQKEAKKAAKKQQKK